MLTNDLTASLKTEYPEIWENAGCATCIYFSSTKETDNWEWKCEHPNGTEYVDSHSTSPRAECPGHYLGIEETIKRVYVMRDLLQRDYDVEIVVVPIHRDSIQINGKIMRCQTALALLTNLYKSHASYKRVLDRLNYCRHILKIKDIK